ncbi:hypothetical protein ACWGDE_01705 [Streptomyces sp. NPDC054956]
MSFPSGTPTVTLVGRIPSAVAGVGYAGLIDCRPSAYLVDSTRHAVYPGGGKVAFASDGTFSVVLLPCDAAGVQPEGWRWHLDLQPKGGRRIQFYANIVGTGTVYFDTLTPVPAPGGGPGGGGSAVSSVNGMIGAVVLDADDVDADPEGAAATAVSAHAVATDPHGDRAAAAASLASHEADTTSVHGIANTAALETQAGSQAKADAAQAAATVTAAADATSKVAAHEADTTAVHGIANTALLETGAGAQSKADAAQAAAISTAAADATTKVGAHTAAGDPHGDRADAASKYLAKTANLSDLASPATARTSLGLGGAATLSVGTAAGTVAAGDDARFPSATPWVFDIASYGAVGDVRTATDAAMTSGSAVLTCASGPFTVASSPVGKYVIVKGAAATGVTSHIATIASRQSDTQVTLASNAATTVTGALLVWGTDNTTAIQAATDAAEAYLAAGNRYAQVYTPPRPYLIAGPLNNSKSGNGQIVFGVYATSANKPILEFRGASDGAAAVRHWQQTVPQLAGSCWVSAGVYASTSAQINNINADGNPGVLSGPNEGFGYGQAALYSNVMPVIRNMTILTTHSSFGLTYGAANLYGCANAHIENLGIGTLGTVASPSTDYTSPGVFGTGLSVGLLLPAPGNNDNIIAKNVSVGGGYTYAMFITEHAVVDRYMALYCWAGLVAVGTYAGSVGSVHAMLVLSASIEACTNDVYIMGAGSSGIGPIIDIIQLSTESGTPNIAGNSTAAMNAALGTIRLTGLFTESGVSTSDPTGIEIVNGQVPRAIKRKIGAFTCSPIDRTLVCDTTEGAFTGTLPAADFNPVEYVFKNIGSNNLTVATTSSQLIYTTSGTGAATATVTTGQTLRVQALYNGTSWGWYAV